MEEITNLMSVNMNKLKSLRSELQKETVTIIEPKLYTKIDKTRRPWLYSKDEGKRHPITGFKTKFN